MGLNQLSFPLAPKITVVPSAAAGPNIVYTVTSSPEVWPDQYVTLLLNDQEVVADPHHTQTATVNFHAQNLSAGTYFVRLRIDGVDSLLVNKAVNPPQFDSSQQVNVT